MSAWCEAVLMIQTKNLTAKNLLKVYWSRFLVQPVASNMHILIHSLNRFDCYETLVYAYN